MLKAGFSAKKHKVLAEILPDEPQNEVWIEKDRANDTEKGFYFFYQTYNPAKKFYDKEFTLFKREFMFQEQFFNEQVVLMVQGSKECS